MPQKPMDPKTQDFLNLLLFVLILTTLTWPLLQISGVNRVLADYSVYWSTLIFHALGLKTPSP